MRLDSLMYTARRGLKKKSNEGKPEDYALEVKRKKGHLEGNKLRIKLDMTPRLKKDKNPFNQLQ